MRFAICVIASSLVLTGCSKGKTCSTQSTEAFVGSRAPSAELAAALGSLASRNRVCGTSNRATLVIAGSRSSAVDAIDAALKGAGFHDVPGRSRSEGSTMILSFFKTKDATNGDLVELAVRSGDDCEFGDVCVENRGYSVVPR